MGRGWIRWGTPTQPPTPDDPNFFRIPSYIYILYTSVRYVQYYSFSGLLDIMFAMSRGEGVVMCTKKRDNVKTHQA